MTNDPNFECLIARGLEASRQQCSDTALQLFAQASALVPASGVPHFLIGSEHASCGDIDAAEAAFARAVLLAPEFTLARYQLGLLQYSSQRAAMALLTWQPLLALPDPDSLGHFVRGFEALARDSFDEALRHYRAGLACNDLNQAMAADIQRVVEAVERLPGASGAAPPASGAAPTPPEANAADASHVLLSAYAKGPH